MEQNNEAFVSFKKIHNLYQKEPDKWQEQFNSQGRDILDIIRRFEKQLCGKSENSGYGAFSGKLAEKFWGEIRCFFPKIDFIGVKKN